MAKLAVGLALSTLAAAAAIGNVVRISTAGQGHRVVTYVASYSVATLAVGLVVLFTVAVERRRGRTTDSPDAETTRLALRVYSELDANRSRVARAVDSGQFWNVEVEGLQRTEWDGARDWVAQQAPAVWGAVDRAYVLSDAMNDAANDYYHRGTRDYGEPIPERLKELRIALRTAMERLEPYLP